MISRHKVLLTSPIRSRADFYAEIGALDDAPAPRNLDALADFVREHHITRIIAADLCLPRQDYEAILEVLDDNGVTLLR